MTSSDVYNLCENLQAYKFEGDELKKVEDIWGDMDNVDGINPGNKYYRYDEEIDTRTYSQIQKTYEYNPGGYSLPIGKVINEDNLYKYFDIEKEENKDDKKNEKASESDDEYIRAYEAFVRGDIADTTGKKIDYYTDDFENVSYYYIKAKESEHEALVINYVDASSHNDIYYYEDGQIVYKTYFGRHALGGSSLYAETYICFDSCLPCGCDISEITMLDKNYNEVPFKKLFFNYLRYCTDNHENGIDGYEDVRENMIYSGSEYIENVVGYSGEEYYEAPENAIVIK